jgi:hypothetical protein
MLPTVCSFSLPHEHEETEVYTMRPQGQTKLGFFPLPIVEAKRLKNWITFPERFSVIDPCVGEAWHSLNCCDRQA